MIFIILISFILLHSITALLIRRTDIITKDKLYEMSILIPCYNEASIIDRILINVQKTKYEKCEFIIINDGSTDNTIDLLLDRLQLIEYKNSYKEKIVTKEIKKIYKSSLYNNCYVIDKYNGGKGDSLNTGINLSSKDYIVTLDADCILKEDALYQINNILDENVVGVGGNVIPAQCITHLDNNINYTFKRTLLLSTQFIEYCKGFLILKESYCYYDSLAIISGAFGVFNRKALIEVNGYEDTIGEDIDITLKIQKYAKENEMIVKYNKNAICFTEVPNNYKDLAKQRIRWQKAFIDAIIRHFKYFLSNPFKPITLFNIIENVIVSYGSILITLWSGLYVIYTILNKNNFDLLFYIIILTGVSVLILQNIVVFILMKNIKMKSIDKINIFKILILFIYDILIYKYICMIIIIYGTLEYPFNKKSWNKLDRNNDNINL